MSFDTLLLGGHLKTKQLKAEQVKQVKTEYSTDTDTALSVETAETTIESVEPATDFSSEIVQPSQEVSESKALPKPDMK